MFISSCINTTLLLLKPKYVESFKGGDEVNESHLIEILKFIWDIISNQ